MMTQEEYMDVLAMRRQGMSYVEIGEELGYHPDTISAWVKKGGPRGCGDGPGRGPGVGGPVDGVVGR